MKNYTFKELYFTSSDGNSKIHAEMYVPVTGVRAVVQIAHGMIDYVGRYEVMADALAEAGIALVGNDHLGHGKSVSDPNDFGYFAQQGGYLLVVDDLKKMNDVIKSEFPGVPVVLLGHSMGSFMARIYAARHPGTIDALIVHGTGGPNPLLAPGKLVAKIIRFFRGSRHRSKLINQLAFGSYNKRFPKEEGEHAWLTREVSRVASRDTDPYTTFKFTVSAYIDLFSALGAANSERVFLDTPKNLPTLVISGTADPVGDYGKGVKTVYDCYEAVGVENLTLKLYPEARHELFNETNRDEVFGYLKDWIFGVI